MIEFGKNYLLILRNKKNICFKDLGSLLEEFSSCGYYFERISCVAFDNSSEIVNSLKDIKNNYENTVIFCPHIMAKTLKEFIGNLYSADFVGDRLVKESNNVFMIYTDGYNSVTVKDICDTLNDKYGTKYEIAYIRTVGAPLNVINSAMSKAKNICDDLQFNVKSSFGDSVIEIIYGNEIKKSDFDNAYRELLKILNEYVYALENISLAERLIQLLKLRRMKICVAESFTGGGIGKRLVEIPGASQVYLEGLNTYSNESKIQRLGVAESTFKYCGAVSEETAVQMAEGLINGGNCDISIATTGIAGPKSDNTNKPVGLIYIAVGLDDCTNVFKYNLNGSREEITETAINIALFQAFKTVKNRRSNI